MFPATGYLFLAWETLAVTKGIFYYDFSVEFTDVKFLRATSLTKDSEVIFIVVVQPGTGRFEISEGSSTLVTGFIKQVDKSPLTDINADGNTNSTILKNRDFYKELRLRGYHYNGLFRSVTEGRGDGLYGKVKWASNWVAFLDCLLQIQILGQDTRSLILPTSIQKMIIDTPKQLEMVSAWGDESNPIFEVFVSPELKTIRSGGIEITNLQANVVGRRRPPGIPVLEYYKFVPYHNAPLVTLNDGIRLFVQLALENMPTTKVKAVEIDGNIRKTILANVRDAVGDLPVVTSELLLLSTRTIEEENGITIENGKISSQTSCFFIIASDCINNTELLENAAKSFGNQGLFICRENHGVRLDDIMLPENYKCISSIITDEETFVVLQYTKDLKSFVPNTVLIDGRDPKFEWVENLKPVLKSGPCVLVAQNETFSGIVGLVNCLRKEPEGSNVQCVFIDDTKAASFNINDTFYQNQINLGLAINVLRDGKWGSYRHLQIETNFTPRSARDHCYVNALVKSDLSSLKWISGPFNYSKPKGELIRVQYAALNFRDVMLATGKLSADVFAENRMEHECVLGIEYSGVTKSGRRVMGMTLSAAMVTFALLLLFG